jgi:hypothetical protein
MNTYQLLGSVTHPVVVLDLQSLPVPILLQTVPHKELSDRFVGAGSRRDSSRGYSRSYSQAENIRVLSREGPLQEEEEYWLNWFIVS